MATYVKDLMLALSEYAVVDESATVLEALRTLHRSQENLPPGRQPHRAVLVRNPRGEIIGKLHHFAFLRALVPDRKAMATRDLLDRAGVSDDLRESSMQTLDLLTADLLDVCERLRHVGVREVHSAIATSVDENTLLVDATAIFLKHQTLSLLVTRGSRTVGILRLSDFIDELSRQADEGDCSEERR